MFKLVYVFDTAKTEGETRMPKFIARIILPIGRRFGKSFDFVTNMNEVW